MGLKNIHEKKILNNISDLNKFSQWTNSPQKWVYNNKSLFYRRIFLQIRKNLQKEVKNARSFQALLSYI